MESRIERRSLKKGGKKRPAYERLEAEVKQYWQLYLLVLLPLIYLITFKYVPIYGAQIAFRSYSPVKGIMGSPWVGFDNFVRFFQSYQCWKIIKNTLLLSIYSLVAGFPFPIILALAMNYIRSNHLKKAVQTVTFIPHFISVTIIVGLIFQLFNSHTGIVNVALELMTGKKIDFMAEPKYFRSLYVWSGIWQDAGWNSVIYIAAMAGIDPQLHEAAMVDGASKLRRIWHIDIPGILPTAIIMLIMNMGKLLTVGFEKVYIMQNPLNLAVSETIETYVYNIGLGSQQANYSYPAAIGLVQSGISLLLVIAVNNISKKVTESSLW